MGISVPKLEIKYLLQTGFFIANWTRQVLSCTCDRKNASLPNAKRRTCRFLFREKFRYLPSPYDRSTSS